MGSFSIPSAAFSGQSKFASDFQQVLTRAVAIASLPLQNLQNALQTLDAQQSSLSSLQSTFNSLQSALQNIGSSSDSLSATSSDPSSVTAVATSSALPGTYTVQVTGLGSPTTVISAAGTPPVADPTTGNLSSATSFTLTVNGTQTTITPTGSSLDSLASAINGAGAGVQATIVNVGSTASPDYRLSVTSNNLAADTIQLNDGTKDLLNAPLAPGAPTAFTVDGVSTTSNSSTVTLAPGLTVNLLQQTASPVTISVAQDSGSLGSSLSSFATAYNSAVDALTAQHGQSAGALAGDSTILELNQALSSINQYTGTGTGLTTLADIGLTLDSSGHLNFNPTTFTSADPSTVQQFLGGLTTGGFLQTVNNTLTSITDSSTGLIQDSLSTLQTSISHENTQISQQQDRIATLQANMQQQLANADATLTVLESQVTTMTNLFSTMFPSSSSTTGTGVA